MKSQDFACMFAIFPHLYFLKFSRWRCLAHRRKEVEECASCVVYLKKIPDAAMPSSVLPSMLCTDQTLHRFCPRWYVQTKPCIRIVLFRTSWRGHRKVCELPTLVWKNQQTLHWLISLCTRERLPKRDSGYVCVDWRKKGHPSRHKWRRIWLTDAALPSPS